MKRSRKEIMDAIPGITSFAVSAFWLEVARHIPEATFGDIGPEDLTSFESRASRAITGWVEANVPANCNECGRSITGDAEINFEPDGKDFVEVYTGGYYLGSIPVKQMSEEVKAELPDFIKRAIAGE